MKLKLKISAILLSAFPLCAQESEMMSSEGEGGSSSWLIQGDFDSAQALNNGLTSFDVDSASQIRIDSSRKAMADFLQTSNQSLWFMPSANKGPETRGDYQQLKAIDAKLRPGGRTPLKAMGKLLSKLDLIQTSQEVIDSALSGYADNRIGGLVTAGAGKLGELTARGAAFAAIVAETTAAGAAYGGSTLTPQGLLIGAGVGAVGGVGIAIGVDKLAAMTADEMRSWEFVQNLSAMGEDALNKVAYKPGSLNSDYLDAPRFDELMGRVDSSKGSVGETQQVGSDFAAKVVTSAQNSGMSNEVGALDGLADIASQKVGQSKPSLDPDLGREQFSPELTKELEGITTQLIPMFESFPEGALDVALAGIGAAQGLTLDEMKTAVAIYQGNHQAGSAIPNGASSTDAFERELKLLSGNVPQGGRDLVALALVEDELNVRIFDASGKRTKSLAEPEMSPSDQEKITFLRSFLSPLQSVESLSDGTKSQIIQTAESLKTGRGLIEEIEETQEYLRTFNKVNERGQSMGNYYAMEAIELERLKRDALQQGVRLDGSAWMSEEGIREKVDAIRERAENGEAPEKLRVP